MAIDPYSAANSDMIPVFGYGSNNLLPDGDYNPSQPDVMNGFQYQSQSASSVMNTSLQQTALKVNHNLINGIPQWSATTPYEIGAAVQKDGLWYRCIQGNTGQDPKDNTDYWVIASNSNLIYQKPNISGTTVNLDNNSNSKFIDCEFATDSTNLSVHLPASNFDSNFYCELFIRNNLNTPMTINFISNSGVLINSNNTDSVNIPPKNSGSIVKVLWKASAGGGWFICTPIIATNTDYGLVNINQLQSIVQGVLDSEFNSTWPVGSTFPSIQGSTVPPKQGQIVAGVQVNWVLVEEGNTVMSGNSGNVGQITGSNRLDDGATDEHTLVQSQMPAHQHITPWGESNDRDAHWGIAPPPYNRNQYGLGADADGDNWYRMSSWAGGLGDEGAINPEPTEPHSHNLNVKTIKLMLWRRIS